jgi:RNA polymerase sigma-70 factor (ECF subfamily)
MNDGFLKVYKELQRFQLQSANPMAGFKAWIKKIMVFTAIDHYRKNHKHQHNDLDDGLLVIADNSETQLDKLTHKEIMACVQLLPPAYRTVFSLFVLDGFTHDEIARHLGIAVGTSKSNLAKARVHLQRLLLSKQNFNRYEQRVAR